MNNTMNTVTAEIEIKASPERVWEAWTTPEQLLTWWGSEETYHGTRWEIDLRPGGKYRSEGVIKDGRDFWVHGEYIEVDPPRRLVFTWMPSWEDEEPTQVSLEFLPTASGTLLKVVHSGFRAEDSRQGHYEGWNIVIGQMKAYVERETA